MVGTTGRSVGGVLSALLLLLVAVAAGLGAPVAMAADVTTQVSNVAPTVTSVTLPGSSINPTAGTTTGVSTTIVVDDLNGYNDIASVTLEVLKPDGSTTHIAASAATFSSGSLTTATYTKSFNMNFHDDPALTTNTYKVKVVATDVAGLTGNNLASLQIFNYAQLAALSISPGTIDLGSNLDTEGTGSTVTIAVQNHGNVQMDAQLSGTALTHATESATIPVGNVAYSTASDMTGSAALTGSAVTLSAFDLAKGASSTKNTYWRVTVPDGDAQWVPSGAYTGTITVGAVAG